MSLSRDLEFHRYKASKILIPSKMALGEGILFPFRGGVEGEGRETNKFLMIILGEKKKNHYFFNKIMVSSSIFKKVLKK